MPYLMARSGIVECVIYAASVLRYSDRTEICQVACSVEAAEKTSPAGFAEKMKTKIDSAIGKAIYGKRIVIAEPPFAHIRRVMGLDRFTLRGRSRVNGQW